MRFYLASWSAKHRGQARGVGWDRGGASQRLPERILDVADRLGPTGRLIAPASRELGEVGRLAMKALELTGRVGGSER